MGDVEPEQPVTSEMNRTWPEIGSKKDVNTLAGSRLNLPYLIKFQIQLLFTLSMALMVPRKSTIGLERALPVELSQPRDQMEKLMARMNSLELLTATLSFRTVAA